MRKRTRPVRRQPAAAGVVPAFYAFTRFRVWLPALPFLTFWVASVLLFYFGPVIYPPIRWGTLGYLALNLGLFALAYQLALPAQRSIQPPSQESVKMQNGFAPAWVRWAAPLALAGALGLVADRMLYGGASIEKTLTETEFVRGVARTTLLTTIAMVPYCLSRIALVFFFYSVGIGWRVPFYVRFCVWATLATACFNAFLGANRGMFFFVLVDVLYLVIFVQGVELKPLLFGRRFFFARLLLLAFLGVTFVYFQFISTHRSGEWSVHGLYLQYKEKDRYKLLDQFDDVESVVGTLHVLEYGSHTLPALDALMPMAKPFEFNPALLLGGRMLSQVRRVFPDYSPAGYKLVKEWDAQVNVGSESMWITMFGWNLATAGYVGALLLMMGLGGLLGGTTRRFVTRLDGASALINFCIYSALRKSFDHFVLDLPDYLGIAVGLWLITQVRVAARPRTGRRKRSLPENAVSAPANPIPSEMGATSIREIENGI